jgi:hypothetical protein
MGGPDAAPNPNEPDAGAANVDCELLFSSGFENDLEKWDYNQAAFSADGSMPDGRVSAWTIVDEGSGQPIRSGRYAYKGWIEGTASESHRPYPGISLREDAIETPLINTFWVYQSQVEGEGWVHFGTWGNCVQDGGNCGTGNWALHTMSVLNDLLEFAHTDPHGGVYLGPEPRVPFPYNQWVRFTVYVNYGASTGTVQVWQDGIPMLRADVVDIDQNSGTPVLGFAHWGAYAAGTVSATTQYNDDIQVWSVSEPLADLVNEPRCE